ncbi:MAG: oligoendopeptidase F [Ignavibacterium sp.]|nr:oligoendopeptidase F [Ignavibacterium sp.]MDW8374492.1 oligoendopeptidase F [Ignavibacteriales bacterium]
MKLDNLFFSNSINTTEELLERNQVDEKLKWNLKDIYQTDENWEEDFNWVEKNYVKYKDFKGKLKTSSQSLIECLKFDESICVKLDRLALYAMLSKDSDLRVQIYQSMDNRIKSLYSKVLSESSFIKPEILEIDREVLNKWLMENEELKLYEHYLDDIFRWKNHSHDPTTESILALSTELMQIPYNTFSILSNVDLKFPTIKDENGKDYQLSHGRFYSAMYSKNRQFRENAYLGFMSAYKEFSKTLNTIFNGNLKSYIFNSKVRNFNSALEAALHKDNIPVDIYKNLINSVGNNLAQIHRWAHLKREFLRLEKLKPYDTYVSLFNGEVERSYSYEDSQEILKNSLKIFGDEYISILEKAINERWIDVIETKGKRSGAYSSGTTFGVHPYVLLNWNFQLNDVFTFAHEIGHNLHSYFTGVSQPYVYANYSIFLAEVASTVNEGLLLEYLINNADSKSEKIILIEKYLNNITATFYRQIMFAEFEMKVYELTENGAYLTVDDLCKLYGSLYQKYWGEAIDVIEEETFTWARIPHFYYNFYVFQYATGFAASEQLLKNIKENGSSAIEKYLDFLKAGSHKYPLDVLLEAGVDMNSTLPIDAVSHKMENLLNQLESLIK